MYSRILGTLLFLLAKQLAAQDGLSKVELLRLLKTNVADTTRIDTYNELAWPVYCYDQPDSSLYYAKKAISLAEALKDQKRLSIAHRRVGITYLTIGDIKNSILNEEISYKISENINFKRGMHLALNNIGVAYLNNELFNKALGYFLKSISIAESLKDSSTLSKLYINCGLIYGRLEDVAKSKMYFLKALSIAKIKKDKNLLVVNNCNLSAVFRNLGQIDSARTYVKAAEKYLDSETSTETKFNYYLSIGLLQSFAKENKEALFSFLKCRDYVTNPNTEITLYINIADEYSRLGNTNEAFRYYQLAYDLSRKNNTYNNLVYTSSELAKIHKTKKNWQEFANMIKLHLSYRDSNAKINAVQQIQKQQLEFDYERKQIADSIKFEQRERLKTAQLALANEQLSRQKTFGTMLISILAAIVLISVFIFNRLVVIRRQKKIIELQKQIMDVKNQEVLDSINYARRLQAAILPQMGDIKAELDFDLLYLPKDIIGGDFYFFEKNREHVFIAVCDCTGHGIPGAIMSVVCYHALQKSIKEFNLSDPGEILSSSRRIVIDSLNASQQNIKDGMDCSLLVINTISDKISWAGANNPLWIVDQSEPPASGKNRSEGLLRELKPDKQPVAFYENHSPFTTQEVHAKAGSCLYLFSDGYADQFGGFNGKKYKTKALKGLLSSLAHLPTAEQVDLMQANFNSWRNNLDQVDDVAIAVIKL